MVWPDGHGMVFGMAWEGIACYTVLPWHDIWYGLMGMAWYVLWPDGHMVWTDRHGMVYGMAWLAYGMVWQVMAWLWYDLSFMALYMV